MYFNLAEVQEKGVEECARYGGSLRRVWVRFVGWFKVKGWSFFLSGFAIKGSFIYVDKDQQRVTSRRRERFSTSRAFLRFSSVVAPFAIRNSANSQQVSALFKIT